MCTGLKIELKYPRHVCQFLPITSYFWIASFVCITCQGFRHLTTLYRSLCTISGCPSMFALLLQADAEVQSQTFFCMIDHTAKTGPLLPTSPLQTFSLGQDSEMPPAALSWHCSVWKGRPKRGNKNICWEMVVGQRWKWVAETKGGKGLFLEVQIQLTGRELQVLVLLIIKFY